MAAGNIIQGVRWLRDAAGQLVGYRNPITDKDEEVNLAAVQSLVSGARKNSRLAHRFAGGSSPSVGTQQIRTFINRIEAEAPFRRVRFHLFSGDTAAAWAGVKVAAASTDTLSEATATLRSQPHRSGTPYASAAADAASPGWVSATFAGSATGTLPQATSTYRFGVLTTDWMDISSVDRTDVSGARPALLMRMYGDIKFTSSGNITTDAGGVVTAWRNNSSLPWYRVHDMASYTGDGIADLTQNGGSISNSIIHFAVEFDYSAPGLSVLAVGDSLTEGTVESGKYAPWQYVACTLASSQTFPIAFQNCGHGGQTSATFDPPGLDMITLLKPTHVFHQAYSSNDGDPTTTRIALAMSRLNRTLAAAREVGARVCVWTPLATSSNDATEDAQRQALRTEILARSAAYSEFDVIDIESIMDGATPARMLAAYDLDGVHYNRAGMDVLAALGASYLQRFRY
jgi:lysophospholipase L1-like esterase